MAHVGAPFTRGKDVRASAPGTRHSQLAAEKMKLDWQGLRASEA